MQNREHLIENKIERTLEESRVVLPGIQAILGFQLVSVFSAGFINLPQETKAIHLISLILLLLSTIFLMATAAYHPIAEKGRSTERVHKFGKNMVLTGMFLFLFGMAGDIYIVSGIITNSSILQYISTGSVLLIALILWYIYPVLKRK